MATHGRKARIFANGFDLTGFFRKAEDEATVEALDATVFNMNSKKFVSGLVEGKLSAEGLYESDPVNLNRVEDVLRLALAVDDVPVTYLPEGDGFGNLGVGLIGEETTYKVSSPVEGLIEVSTEFMSNSGIETVKVIHVMQAEAATGQSTNLDNGASSAAGASAYLHVPDVVGAAPSLGVKVQHSVDNVTWADLVTFAAVTVDGKAERKEVASGTTINRHIRSLWTFGGTMTGATFAVAFGRK